MEKIKASTRGFFSSLNGAKIRFNPRPWSNHEHLFSKKIDIPSNTMVDLHLELEAKVDELITQLEQEKELPEFKEVVVLSSEQNKITPTKISSEVEDDVLGY